MRTDLLTVLVITLAVLALVITVEELGVAGRPLSETAV